MMFSISERFNQTLENMLLKLDGDAEWDKILQQVVFGYNTSKHASTKFFPCMGGELFERHCDVTMGAEVGWVQSLHIHVIAPPPPLLPLPIYP